MKKTESFPFLTDQVLGELEEAAWINIELNPEALVKTKNQIDTIIVKTVNGHCSAQRYMNWIIDLKTETMVKLSEALSQVAQVDIETFIKQVRRRLRRIRQSVHIKKPIGMETSLIQNVRWSADLLKHLILLSG